MGQDRDQTNASASSAVHRCASSTTKSSQASITPAEKPAARCVTNSVGPRLSRKTQKDVQTGGERARDEAEEFWAKHFSAAMLIGGPAVREALAKEMGDRTLEVSEREWTGNKGPSSEEEAGILAGIGESESSLSLSLSSDDSLSGVGDGDLALVEGFADGFGGSDSGFLEKGALDIAALSSMGGEAAGDGIAASPTTAEITALAAEIVMEAEGTPTESNVSPSTRVFLRRDASSPLQMEARAVAAAVTAEMGGVDVWADRCQVSPILPAHHPISKSTPCSTSPSADEDVSKCPEQRRGGVKSPMSPRPSIFPLSRSGLKSMTEKEKALADLTELHRCQQLELKRERVASADKDKEIQRLKVELGQLESQVYESRRQVDDVSAFLEKEIASGAALKSTCRAQEEQLGVRAHRVEEAEAQKTLHAIELNAARERCQTLEDELRSTKVDQEAMVLQKKRFDCERTDFLNKITSLETNLGEEHRKLQDALSTVQDLERDRSSVQVSLANLHSEKTEVDRAHLSCQQALQLERESHSLTTARLEEAEGASLSSQRDAELFRRRSDQVADIAERLREEVAVLTTTKTELFNRCRQLEVELHGLKQSSKNEKQRHAEEMKKLQRDHEQALEHKESEKRNLLVEHAAHEAEILSRENQFMLETLEKVDSARLREESAELMRERQLAVRSVSKSLHACFDALLARQRLRRGQRQICARIHTRRCLQVVKVVICVWWELVNARQRREHLCGHLLRHCERYCTNLVMHSWRQAASKVKAREGKWNWTFLGIHP